MLPGAALLLLTLGLACGSCRADDGGTKGAVKRRGGGAYASLTEDLLQINPDLEAPSVAGSRTTGRRGGLETTSSGEDGGGGGGAESGGGPSKVCGACVVVCVAPSTSNVGTISAAPAASLDGAAAALAAAPPAPAQCGAAPPAARPTRELAIALPLLNRLSKVSASSPVGDGDDSLPRVVRNLQRSYEERATTDVPASWLCSQAEGHDLTAGHDGRGGGGLPAPEPAAITGVKGVGVDGSCRKGPDGDGGIAGVNGVVDGVGIDNANGGVDGALTPDSPAAFLRKERDSLSSLSDTLQRVQREQAAEHAAAALLSLARARSIAADASLALTCGGSDAQSSPHPEPANVPGGRAAGCGSASGDEAQVAAGERPRATVEGAPAADTAAGGVLPKNGTGPAGAASVMRRILGLGLIGAASPAEFKDTSLARHTGAVERAVTGAGPAEGEESGPVGIVDAGVAGGAARHAAGADVVALSPYERCCLTPHSMARRGAGPLAYSPPIACSEADQESLDAAIREMLTLPLPPMRSLRASPVRQARPAPKAPTPPRASTGVVVTRLAGCERDDIAAGAQSDGTGRSVCCTHSNTADPHAAPAPPPLACRGTTTSPASSKPPSPPVAPPKQPPRGTPQLRHTSPAVSGAHVLPDSTDAATSPFCCGPSPPARNTPHRPATPGSAATDAPDSSSRVIWSLVDYIQRLHGSIDHGALLEIQNEIDALTAREAQLLADGISFRGPAAVDADATGGAANDMVDGAIVAAAGDPAANVVATATLDIGLGDTARDGRGAGASGSADGGKSGGEGSGGESGGNASEGAGASGQGCAGGRGGDAEACLDEEARQELSRLRLRMHVLRSELEQILARLMPEPGTPGIADYVPFEAATRGNQPRRVLDFEPHAEEHG